MESSSQDDPIVNNAMRIIREIHERSSMCDYVDVLNELGFLHGQCENDDVRDSVRCAIAIVGELAIASNLRHQEHQWPRKVRP